MHFSEIERTNWVWYGLYRSYFTVKFSDFFFSITETNSKLVLWTVNKTNDSSSGIKAEKNLVNVCLQSLLEIDGKNAVARQAIFMLVINSARLNLVPDTWISITIQTHVTKFFSYPRFLVSLCLHSFLCVALRLCSCHYVSQASIRGHDEEWLFAISKLRDAIFDCTLDFFYTVNGIFM